MVFHRFSIAYFLKITYAVTSEQGIKQDLCSYYFKIAKKKSLQVNDYN